ncbi:MAG: STAS domain-containing protein [Cytophagales bacterium]|nr:STAS domain-containing protein [Armatimonadota bacterium]
MEEQSREAVQDDAPEIRIIGAVRTHEGVCVIEVHGEVDLSTSPQLKTALAEAGKGSRQVIVDLSAVGYMDSSGFGILLSATKNLRPEGGSLYLVGCNGSIQRMLEITRLNTLFNLYATADEARNAIQASTASAPDTAGKR